MRSESVKTEKEWKEVLLKEQAKLLMLCINWLNRLNKEMLDLSEAKSDTPDEIQRIGAYNFARGFEVSANILTVVLNNMGKGRKEKNELVDKLLKDYFQNQKNGVSKCFPFH